MPTYYDVLNVQPTASQAEIETAIETQYNQWRRLVTHYDPAVVNQANQSLQALETIRSVLTNPANRSVYDAGIGATGAVGGLADPAAFLQMTPGAPMTPPAKPVMQTQSATVVAGATGWVCPKCQTPNAEGTRFCKRCGQALARECPQCGALSEVGAIYCSGCGTNFDEAIRAKERADYERRLQEESNKKLWAQQQAQLQPMMQLSQSAKNWTIVGWLLCVVFWPAAIPVFIVAINKAGRVLNMPVVPGDTSYRDTAKRSRTWSLIPLIFGFVVAACAILSTLSMMSAIRYY
jgi:uncharacterized Zn finger protein (UPF0148 family)